MLRQFVVDAFSEGPFTGNPAAVVVLPHWLEEHAMQAIAAQNNLSETAFFVEGAPIALRWFTPTTEIDLCGHATLATAHVIFDELGDERAQLEFATASGLLGVWREGEGYAMSLPEILRDASEPATDLIELARAAAGVANGEVLLAGGRTILVLEDATVVANLAPDLLRVAALPGGELIVSAAGGGQSDIVARVFAPGVGIDEDPVTGAAHCALAPYWAERLGQSELTSRQLSQRGGRLGCRWQAAEGRVELSGNCRTFARSQISL